MWSKLAEILEQLVGVYRTLLILSRHKREVLVSARTDELEALTRREELAVMQAGKLENVRKELLRQIAAGKVTDQEPTFDQLCDLADEAAAGRLRSAGEQLRQVCDELASLNQINTRLIEQALTMVNYNLNLLAQNAAETTYAPQGAVSAAPQSRAIFDRKV